MKVVKGIIVAFLCLLALLFFSTDFSGGGIVILIVAAVYFFFMPTKSPKKKREEYLKTIGAVELFKGTHVAGLPIGETPCTITFFLENIKLEGGGGTYNIGIDRLRDVNVKQDVEIQKEISSSLAKGIAGGVLFGTAGAIIGSRAKVRNKKLVTLYVIINYLKEDNQMDSICLDMGTYTNSGMNSVALAQADAQQRLKKVKGLISREEYTVNL